MLNRALIWIGGIALLAATAIDTLSVIGRHVGLPFRGSIELVQAMVLVSGTVSLAIAAIARNHARVRLVVDRLGDGGRALADRLSDAGSALFYLALLAGSLRLAADLWNGHELSEVIGVPWWLLRLFANIGLAAAFVLTLSRVLARRAP